MILSVVVIGASQNFLSRIFILMPQVAWPFGVHMANKIKIGIQARVRYVVGGLKTGQEINRKKPFGTSGGTLEKNQRI